MNSRFSTPLAVLLVFMRVTFATTGWAQSPSAIEFDVQELQTWPGGTDYHDVPGNVFASDCEPGTLVQLKYPKYATLRHAIGDPRPHWRLTPTTPSACGAIAIEGIHNGQGHSLISFEMSPVYIPPDERPNDKDGQKPRIPRVKLHVYEVWKDTLHAKGIFWAQCDQEEGLGNCDLVDPLGAPTTIPDDAVNHDDDFGNGQHWLATGMTYCASSASAREVVDDHDVDRFIMRACAMPTNPNTNASMFDVTTTGLFQRHNQPVASDCELTTPNANVTISPGHAQQLTFGSRRHWVVDSATCFCVKTREADLGHSLISFEMQPIDR